MNETNPAGRRGRQGRVRRVAIGAATVLFGAAIAAQQPGAPPGLAAPAGAAVMTLPSGPGLTEFQTTCVMCHTPERIVGVRRTRIEWEEVLEKMISRGAQITDANYDPIEEYLLRNFGKANVNRAPKDDLVLVLGLTPADADKIVAFRKEQGPLADFDALLTVPGLDAAVLKAHREAISF